MKATTLSNREFDQDTSRAKKAAEEGPVFITDRGRPNHVLLSMEQYRALCSQRKTLGELLSMDEAESVEFEPSRLGDEIPMPANLG
jgi:prevent-host-death family protein